VGLSRKSFSYCTTAPEGITRRAAIRHIFGLGPTRKTWQIWLPKKDRLWDFVVDVIHILNAQHVETETGLELILNVCCAVTNTPLHCILKNVHVESVAEKPQNSQILRFEKYILRCPPVKLT
jgi:hypothetical protein